MVQFDVKRVSKGTESFMVSFDFAKTPITQVADYIIIAASNNKTSDIHFDPRDEGMMVRFRIDGDCQDYTFIPKIYEKNLTTRIKLMANMNITETRLPQDGAIKGEFGGQYLDMRVACLPTNQGEKIVIRILDYTRSLQGIDSLGFHPKNLEKIKRMMGVPNGIILVTGATGSGKSTTTYSMLQGLNKPEVNVITVEDPVEMNIEGINQVQVNADIGMTFAAALRSILREDPNVILIGEIRDSETAQIAVRASITGHLVMSTLHTNNALATVERLLDMDVERYLLSTALTGIVSQRLCKQLCPDCRYQRETTPYEKKVYKKFLHQDLAMIWDANPKGCDNCRKGYRGRIALHEVLELDEHIRNALNDEKMSKDDFAKMIYTGKTISMLQDALIKAQNGETSFEEVYRTIEIENEDEDNYAEEISEVKDTKEEEEQVLNLPTGDDLLEDESSSKNKTPLTQAYSIPGINAAPEEQTEEATNEQQVESSDIQTEVPATPLEQLTQPVQESEPTQPEQVHEVPAATIGPDGQLIVPAGASENNPDQEQIIPIKHEEETQPVQVQSEVETTIPNTEEPTQPIEVTTTPVINEQVITPTIPVEQEQILQPQVEQQTNIIQPVVETQEPTQQSMQPAPLVPTIEIPQEEIKEENPQGYKIVMPDEAPTEPAPVEQIQPTAPPQDITPATVTATQLAEQPLAPLLPQVEQTTPVQVEYTVSSVGLEDDAINQTIANDITSGLQEIVTTTKAPVQQMEAPSYEIVKEETADEQTILAPSFSTSTNPTELANQLVQFNQPVQTPEVQQQPLVTMQTEPPKQQYIIPVVINENPVEAPIPRVQAVSVLQTITDGDKQRAATGSEVLNDPGIRIAESPIPVINEQQEHSPFIPTIV